MRTPDEYFVQRNGGKTAQEMAKDQEKVNQLIKDYQRRVKTIMIEIKKGGNDLTLNRLGTKVSCYRTFITELEKLPEGLNQEDKV